MQEQMQNQTEWTSNGRDVLIYLGSILCKDESMEEET